MAGKKSKTDISGWISVLLNPDDVQIQEIKAGRDLFSDNFIQQLTENIYEAIRERRSLIHAPFPLNKKFSNLPENLKAFWYCFTERLPRKLKSLNLFIRPFSGFCRSCLITDAEIENMAGFDYEDYRTHHYKTGKSSWHESFYFLPEKKRGFFLELNYLFPEQLKKAGFEIIRSEEVTKIDDKTIRKIARAIHSRYLHEVRKQNSAPGNKPDSSSGAGSKEVFSEKGIPDFEGLPDEIKLSNIDNAYHIPTKLLAVGYSIRPVKKGHKPFALHLNEKEIEVMAAIEHLRWSWDKRLNGWTYGNLKDSLKKKHPGLITYNMLPESEKEKDRELVRLIPAILQDIDYEAGPVNPGRIRKLSYAIKPQSIINRILEETRELNNQIRGMVKIPPEVERMVGIRNKKIEEAINEIEGSYKYARHIQETFLPDDLYVRECFPESFILYKPKDIVSGDFYFFSKREGVIIFAAADCTGHGIPGALLSTIGYGTLDQAVNEVKLSEPHEILHHLYLRVHRFLRQDDGGSGMNDDMDIVLCKLDLHNNLLTWSGVGNPLYRISGGKIFEYSAANFLKDCKVPGDCPFTSDVIPLRTGDSIYLCSDGFTDQFGGGEHKKYMRSRLKNFLLKIRKNTMSEKSDLLYEEIEKWREEKSEEQTDDILVIGIRI